ncbi:MAG: hypothetical protein GY841_21705 [FCB group bacterium]|nr:hypothetical protein [FCB group bacterium]
MKKLTILLTALLLALGVCITPVPATDAPTYEAYVAVIVDGVLGYFTEDGQFVPVDPDNPVIPDPATSSTDPEGDENPWGDPGH